MLRHSIFCSPSLNEMQYVQHSDSPSSSHLIEGYVTHWLRVLASQLGAAFLTRRYAGNCEGLPSSHPIEKAKYEMGKGMTSGPRRYQGSAGGKYLSSRPLALRHRGGRSATPARARETSKSSQESGGTPKRTGVHTNTAPDNLSNTPGPPTPRPSKSVPPSGRLRLVFGEPSRQPLPVSMLNRPESKG